MEVCDCLAVAKRDGKYEQPDEILLLDSVNEERISVGFDSA